MSWKFFKWDLNKAINYNSNNIIKQQFSTTIILLKILIPVYLSYKAHLVIRCSLNISTQFFQVKKLKNKLKYSATGSNHNFGSVHLNYNNMLSKVTNYVFHLSEQKWKSYYFDEKRKNPPYQNTHPEITTDLELLRKLSLKKCRLF